jgi:DNA-binding beta-propeller fold protein YncE
MIIQDTLIKRNPVRVFFCIFLLSVLVQGVLAEESCTFIRSWGSNEDISGTAAYGLAVDSSDNVLVADTGNNRVREYSSGGSDVLAWWEGNGSEYGRFDAPRGIAVDLSHNVYIADSRNHRILKSGSTRQVFWGSEGTGDGQFSTPTGIAVHSSGNVYIADTGNDRIQLFHSTGQYLMKVGSHGNIGGQFNAPEGIAVDSSGTLYVADTGNNRIQKIGPDGTLIAKWGSEGTGDGQFSAPSGIALDSWGNICVIDATSRIQKFSPAGEFISACETGGRNYAVAADPSGDIYVLWQSGTRMRIGELGPRSPAYQAASTPEVYHTLSIVTEPAKPRVTPATSLTTAPPTTTATIVTTAMTPPADDTTTTATPADPVEEIIRNNDKQENILDMITRFFWHLFTGK